MQIRSRDLFQTIKTEGAILPPDVLERVAAFDRDLEGLDPGSYHLDGNRTLNEATNASWNRLQGSWRNFRDAVGRVGQEDLGTTPTRERWLLPLFQELGFGRLVPSKAIELEGKSYPISHFWHRVPIHLVGFRVDLDRRTAGVAGAARSSPHSLVQELLNRSDDYLWGIVSNGNRLRLLRDNRSLTRNAYVEFDLESMMEGEAYSDFVLLWLTVHQSRFEAERPETCFLEKWSQSAQKQGVRALDQLRTGVQEAIEALGKGFLRHPGNQKLKDRLRNGQLDAQEYYRQILRLVYRLIFLFVAEDRDALLLRGDDKTEARNRYMQFYSTSRLRRLAERRMGSRHVDLYIALRLVMQKLGSDQGCPELALPALGSYLFSTEALKDIEDCELANSDLLSAVRALAVTQADRVIRAVDFRNLGSEELGSVYESLLELHPSLNLDAASFTLGTAAGHERRTTGSYYTPDSLVQCLLDSALEPVIEERLKEAKRLANSEWQTEEEKNHAYSVLSRSRNLATRYELGRANVSTDQRIPQRGTLRTHFTDSQGSLFNTGEHRGGLGTLVPGGVSAVSADRSREPSGIGDSPSTVNTNGNLPSLSDSAPAGDHYNTGQTDPKPPSETGVEKEILKEWNDTPFATRYSLLTEKALLSLRICDPAVGSGHFLIAAAHRLAKRLAACRTGDDEPSPEAIRTALRDVVGHCLYGVDVNPMAAELCKVSLWMEALEPGKPLSFLDHHIRVGNSLLGTTPELIAKGIPDEAFKPIEGDDKKVCAKLKERNKAERKGFGSLFVKEDREIWEKLSQAAGVLDAMPDDRPEDIHQKAEAFSRAQTSYDYQARKRLADTWCAAFVIRKYLPTFLPFGITQAYLNDLAHGRSIPAELDAEIERLTRQYQFFHWHLEFPEVFYPHCLIANGYSLGNAAGFDCVLGNPPWEQSELKEKEWFATRRPEIAVALTAAKRKRLIELLSKEDVQMYNEFIEGFQFQLRLNAFLGNSGRYPLCGHGRINTYAVFAELALCSLHPAGRLGCIIPSGIATDENTKLFFQEIVSRRILASLYSFENENHIFHGIHNATKFCLLTTTGGKQLEATANFVFFARSPENINENERRIALASEDIKLLNPNTRTCPVFRSSKDACLTKHVYYQVPILVEQTERRENYWGISFRQGLFNMASDSGLFQSDAELRQEGFELLGNSFRKGNEHYLPLIEAKMIHIYDHRYGTYVGQTQAQANKGNLPQLNDAQHKNPDLVTQPCFWVNRSEVEKALPDDWKSSWLLGWRKICRNVDERTFICAVFPRAGFSNSGILGFPQASLIELIPCLYANFCSFCFDYLVRQKIGGSNMSHFITEQLPVFAPTKYQQQATWDRGISLEQWIFPRVFELTYTASDLELFAKDFGWPHLPFCWDEERRFLLRCELDAAFFHLYLPALANGEWRIASSEDGCPYDETPEQLSEIMRYFPTPLDAVAYIMDTFPIVKRKDTLKYGGEYRTKRVILEIYDAMQESIRTGHPYLARLTPPPGDPACAHKTTKETFVYE